MPTEPSHDERNTTPSVITTLLPIMAVVLGRQSIRARYPHSAGHGDGSTHAYRLAERVARPGLERCHHAARRRRVPAGACRRCPPRDGGGRPARPRHHRLLAALMTSAAL